MDVDRDALSHGRQNIAELGGEGRLQITFVLDKEVVAVTGHRQPCHQVFVVLQPEADRRH